MGFLKKLFIKTKYKPKRHKKMAENSDKKIYVWTKSERAGKIVTEEQVKDGWLYFTDGSRINPSLVAEYLQEYESMEIAKENSSILGASIASPTFTGNVLAKSEEVESPNEISRQVPITGDNPLYVTEEETAAASSSSIISSIVSKLSKKKKTNFEIKIGVNVPGKTVFNALKEELGEEELLEGLEHHVENQINNIIEDIKNQVKTQISKTYE